MLEIAKTNLRLRSSVNFLVVAEHFVGVKDFPRAVCDRLKVEQRKGRIEWGARFADLIVQALSLVPKIVGSSAKGRTDQPVCQGTWCEPTVDHEAKANGDGVKIVSSSPLAKNIKPCCPKDYSSEERRGREVH